MINVQNIDRFEKILHVHQTFLSDIRVSYLIRISIIVVLASLPSFGIAYITNALVPHKSETYNTILIANFGVTLGIALFTLFGERYSYPISIFDVPFLEDVSIASILNFPSVMPQQIIQQDGQSGYDTAWIQKRLPKVYMNYCRYVIAMGMLGLWFFALEMSSGRFHILSALNCICPLIAVYFGVRNYPSSKRLEEIYVNFFRAQQRITRIFKSTE